MPHFDWEYAIGMTVLWGLAGYLLTVLTMGRWI